MFAKTVNLYERIQDVEIKLFLLARPLQDVFQLPLVPWIEQGGSVYFLLHYSMICVISSLF